jgi:hypothetical protein
VRPSRSARSAAFRKALRSPAVRYFRAPSTVCRVCRKQLQPTTGCRRGSCRAILITAPAFLVGKAGEGVERGGGIGMRIEPAMAFRAEAAPLAEQQGMAEQVGPDFHVIEAPFVPVPAGRGSATLFHRTAAAGPDGQDAISGVWNTSCKNCITNRVIRPALLAGYPWNSVLLRVRLSTVLIHHKQ